MNTIKELPQELADQIAAGEVIQNPASLIKELLENSIDAHATSIEIDLIHSGFESIIVKDDGVGIEKEYLHLAPKRHATSKISSFDDLYNISTMGFRGEALASIFSVAKVTLKSKPKNQKYAYQISTPHLDIEKIAHNNGTTILVEDLFYNTPARKKYLKNAQTELKEILKVVKLISIIHPHLKITLINNSKTIFKKTFHSNIKDNCLEILDINPNDELFDISISSPHFIITGFIVNPNNINYATKKHEYVYVNSRPVESKIIHKAVLHGIGTNIHTGRFPLYVLNIIIDPQLIDVNIHPAKLEIKFEQEAFIFEQISKGIEQIFKENLVFKKAQTKSLDKQTKLNNLNIQKSRNLINSNREKSYYLEDSQKELSQTLSPFEEENKKYDKDILDTNSIINTVTNSNCDTIDENSTNYDSTLQKDIIKTSLITTKEVENLESFQGPLGKYLSNYRILGQLHKTFILVETLKGLLVIDQHVVEEKFYFELFKKLYTSKKIEKHQYQQLLKPIILSISKEEELIFTQIQDTLQKLGFDVELLREKEIIVRSLPFNLKGKCLDVSIIKDVLDSMNNSSSFDTLKDSKNYLNMHILEHLAILSCKSSVRAGEELTISQMHELIAKLKRLEEPFNCPHGRPIIIEYSFADFEKIFKRR